MILTYKIQHNCDFSDELTKAKKVAEFAIQSKSRSSADVKHIGLKSIIANQILRKYSKDKKAKRVRRVKLAVPNQGIKVDKDTRTIRLPCLKLELQYHFSNEFEKINQIELDNEYAYLSTTFNEKPQIEPKGYIGVDLNTTGHCAVVGNPTNGKTIKMGKKSDHIHKKYKNMRKNLQKQDKYKKVKRIKNREQRIVKDMNHKISRKIVDTAQQYECGIRLEQLDGIRKTAKSSRSFRYSLNSWSFNQLQQMIEYKAKLLGIPVERIDPKYTSQLCSKCGSMGNRNGKDFKCPNCSHVDNADVNASFNIASRPLGVYQSDADRDVSEGSTDTPKEATFRTRATLRLNGSSKEPHGL